MSAQKRRRMPLPTRIFIGLLAGAAAGVGANIQFKDAAWLNTTVSYVTEPVGQMWLRALIMIVLPLIFASLALGVAGLGDLRKLGRIGHARRADEQILGAGRRRPGIGQSGEV
jgi:DAACS family dicarboxylate/amino acid:cation (Na+ or H+) symporter